MADLLDDVLNEVGGSPSPIVTPEPVDPLLSDAIGETVGEAMRPINLAVVKAKTADPDKYQAHSELAKRFGLPVDLVARNADDLTARAQSDTIAGILSENPALAGWYSAGDNPAAIKVDELRHLSGLSWLGAAAVDAWNTGASNTEFGTLSAKVMNGRATPDEQARADKMYLEQVPRTYAADSWMQKSWARGIEQIPMMWGFLEQGIKGGAIGAAGGAGTALVAGQLGPQIGLPEELITVPGAAAIGGKAGFTAAGYLYSVEQIAGPAYYEFKNLKDENGVAMDDDVARTAAMIAGVGGGILETIGEAKLLSVIPGADKLTGFFTKDAIKRALAVPSIRAAFKMFAVNTLEVGAVEMTTEVGQQAIQMFAGELAKVYENAGTGEADFPLLSAGEMGQQLVDTAQQTAQAMTLLGPALSGSRLYTDIRRANRASREQSIIGAVMDHAKGNELNARLPEKTKEAVRAMTENGPVQNVYLPADKLTEYFQTADEANAFVQAIGMGDEYVEASATGRDMAIPIDVFYSHIAGSDIGDGLRPYIRISLDAMNAADAQAFNDAWAEAQQSLAADYQDDLKAAEPIAQGETAVFDDLKAKAMNAGITPDQAGRYAKLYSTFFRVMGERGGVNPQDLYERYGLDIKRAFAQEKTYRPVDNLDLSLELIRGGKVEKMRKAVAKASGRSLTQAIIDAGGVVDTGGDLATLDVPRKLLKAAKERGATGDMLGDGTVDLGAFNESSLDDMASRMWQNGYFPELQERPTITQFINAIASELGGSPIYSIHDLNDIGEDIKRNAGLIAFADQLDQFGLDPATMDNDAIRAEIERLSNEDPETAALFQFAGRRAETFNSPALMPVNNSGAFNDPRQMTLFQTAPATETAAFKDWFGDSKVVDADGKPLVVYHGTNEKFDSFDLDKPARFGRGSMGRAIYLTPDIDMAGTYGTKIVAAYASIKKPFIYSSEGGNAKLDAALLSLGTKRGDPSMSTVLTKSGYDGIVKKSDAGDWSEIVAFSPTQIKSVNNRGTFDPNDARILNQQDTVQSTVTKPGVKRGSIQLAPNRTIINLFDQADLSTFLHESGHFFLEVFRDLAAAQPAIDPAAMGPRNQISEDWQRVKEFLNLPDDGTIPTEAHEKWARSFEAYLFEGKAPSNEVATMFARFRSWLVFVYKSIKQLNAPINDNIRNVMDRLLASDAEIADAQRSPEFRPMFKTAADAGMTEKQFEAYRATAGKAVDQARRTLDAKLMAEISREKTAEWREAKAAIKKEVTAEYSKAPPYVAIEYLRTGQAPGLPEGTPRLYLDKTSIVDMMGEGALLRLPRSVPPMYRAAGGVHPDVIAELLGFKSGDDMLTQIMSVTPFGRAVVDEVDLRIRQRFGDLMGDAVARAREAAAAISNDDTGELLDAELKVLVTKGLVTTTFHKADAKRMASAMIRGKVIREAVKHKLYMNANAKAATDAERAIKAQDWKAAIAAKQRQMLNHYAAMEAVTVEKETTSAVDYLNKFTGRKRPKNIDPEYLDQIEAMLERFDFRKSISLTAAQKRLSLQEWIAAQEEMGALVAIPDVLRNDAFRKPYKTMTVDDLLAIRDAVKNIEHLGMLKSKLLAAKKQREFEGVRDEMAAAIAASQKKRPSPKTRNPTPLDNFISEAKSLEASMLKLENVFNWMDGGDINGPLRRYVWQPISDAEANENAMRQKYAGKFMTILGRLDAKRLNQSVTVQGVSQAMLRSEIMAVALNMGNEGNLDKMLRGEVWTPQILDALTSNLNAAEWQAVQDIWDMVNEFWPQIAALQKRLTGVEPPKVIAREVETPFGTLAGGYYPLIYDPARAFDVADRGAAAADKMFENTYLRPETRNGFTKERTTAYTRPLLFDLDGAGRHIIAVIHDLTHREAILDAHKLLTNGVIREEISTRYGPELYAQILPWLQSIAHDAYKNDGAQAAERLMRGIRSRATIMGMGYRIATMLTQLAGFFSTVEMVQSKFMAGALKDFAMSPRAMNERVNKLSGEMRFRAQNMDRDIREGLREVAGKVGILDQARKFAFYGIGIMDRAVTVPSWVAAYNQHLSKMPTDKEGAVAYADQVIRLTQGAGGAKDLAAITRRNELTKLLTMFYSYFSAYYNRQRQWGRDARKAIQSGEFADLPDLLSRQVFMTIAPAIVSRLLVGDGPDDDEGYAEWMAKRIAFYPTSALPIVRDAFGVFDKGFAYQMTPAARAVDEVLVKPWGIVGDIVDGDFDARKAVKQTIETAGYAFKLPLGQVASSVDNVWKAIEKDDFQLKDLLLTQKHN